GQLHLHAARAGRHATSSHRPNAAARSAKMGSRWAAYARSRACFRGVGAVPDSRLAGGQVLLLDREDFARFDLDVAHEADPARGVLEARVIETRFGRGDPEALVGVDGSVLVVLALVVAPLGGAGGCQAEFGYGVQSQVP